MSKSVESKLRSLAMVSLLTGLTGCCSWIWHSGCPPNIVSQPQSKIVKIGSPASFSVVATPPPVYYQWEFNGVPIPGANSATYTIASANITDVGAYRVLVWGSPTNTSDTAFLSVYSTSGTGNGGTLTAPVGLFTGSGSCQSVSFDRYHAFFPFDGPNVTSPSPDFPNTSHSPTLTVDTFSSANNQTDTAIQIADNWWPNTTRCCVNDSSGGTFSGQSKCGPYTMSTGANKTYRVGVFYRSATLAPGQTNVTFNWLYQ